jgi:hypothetical protein
LDDASARGEKGGASAGETGQKPPQHDQIPDDGELGGERAGRAVWEAYEVGLRGWDKEGVFPRGEGEGEEGAKART